MKSNKYSIDKIENNIVVLENIRDNTKKEISKDKLPNGIHDGSIIKENNNRYYISIISELLNRLKIKSIFNSLKKR